MLVYEFVSRNVAYRIDLSNLSLLFNNDRDLEEIFLLVLATTPKTSCGLCGSPEERNKNNQRNKKHELSGKIDRMYSLKQRSGAT